MVDEVLPYLPDHEVTEEELDQAHGFELNVPREAGAQLVERMLGFWRESEATYRKHAGTLDNAHRMLAHPTDLRFGHIQRIARRLIGTESASNSGESPEPTLYAVHKALNRTGFAFSFDKRSHNSTGVFQIRSIEQVEMVEKVQRWLRAYQEDMTRMANHGSAVDFQPDARIVNNFVLKARLLIQHSRRTREPTECGHVGPSSIQFPLTKGSNSIRPRSKRSISFTEADQSIIRFMEAWASSRSFTRHPRLTALGPVILRATGEYESLALDPSAGFLFLQEIGVLLPFENRIQYDEHLLLPTSQHSQVLERLKSKTEQEDIQLKDSMQDLRERFTHTVFCIDSSSAVEIDDGISVERIARVPDEYWVHVHVANPTAFFSRNSMLAKIAGHMTETVYMPERNFHMLPLKFAVDKFSLQSHRCAITFSARLNTIGEVLEKKITPSILDRVIRVTPKDCEHALGIASPDSVKTSITVGGEVPAAAKQRHVHLRQSEIEDLRLLIDLTKARRKWRISAGSLSFELGHPEFNVYNRPDMQGLGHAPPQRNVARFVDGDPTIQMQTSPYRLTTSSTGGRQVHNLVEEAMLLACEVGASWCNERSIPIAYRGIGRRFESADPEGFYNTTLRPWVDSGAQVPLHLRYKYLRLHGQTVLNADSIPHRMLGLPHFSRVTSPLRRYGDLIAHWQIEAALREEARIGKSLARSSDNHHSPSQSFLPFSHADVDLVIQRLQPRERLIRRAMETAANFWYAMLVWRAWRYDEAELPATFEVLVYRSASAGIRLSSVLIKEWGTTAYMVTSATDGGCAKEEYRDGDWWEARLHQVDVYSRKVFLEPVRLLSRDT